MTTAVAEVRPPYGFPGSGKRSGGEQPAVVAVGKRRSDGFFIEDDEAEEVLTDTSSIGLPSPSGSSIGENSSEESGGEDGEEEEVESKLKEDDALGCLDALEDSLPIKTGLSSFYSGKSKSFTSLAEATSTVAAAKELAKPENPFNKRRRILANWSRRALQLARHGHLPAPAPGSGPRRRRGGRGRRGRLRRRRGRMQPSAAPRQERAGIAIASPKAPRCWHAEEEWPWELQIS